MIKNYNLYLEDISRAINANAFEKLINKSIMITGANGLIGSAIIDVLNFLNVEKNYNIKMYALVRHDLVYRLKKYDNVIEVKQDVNQEVLLNDNVDFVIHAASNSDPKLYSSDPVGTMLTNFLGLQNVLQFDSLMKEKEEDD